MLSTNKRFHCICRRFIRYAYVILRWRIASYQRQRSKRVGLFTIGERRKSPLDAPLKPVWSRLSLFRIASKITVGANLMKTTSGFVGLSLKFVSPVRRNSVTQSFQIFPTLRALCVGINESMNQSTDQSINQSILSSYVLDCGFDEVWLMRIQFLLAKIAPKLSLFSSK